MNYRNRQKALSGRASGKPMVLLRTGLHLESHRRLHARLHLADAGRFDHRMLCQDHRRALHEQHTITDLSITIGVRTIWTRRSN